MQTVLNLTCRGPKVSFSILNFSFSNMCGIAGIIGEQDQDRAVAKVRLMLRSLEHRGPDDEGIELFANSVLGHRRLSIFDLSSAGHQPMLSPDRKIAVIFNGAIYNFRDLRAELEQKGCSFKSQTDTEVLMHGYREWGFGKLIERLKGMFSIGLWDEDQNKCFLVRDRLGVKPLVYSIDDGTLAFASTVRALKNAGYGGGIDEIGLAEFLEFGFLTDENSIYRKIKKLPAATILEWSNGQITLREYWKPPNSFNERITFDEAVEETERLFLQAVKRRLDADVRVGSLLSGGVDSGLVCWAINHLGGDITAYTVGTPGDEWDESPAASATARKIGIRHRILEMDGQAPPDITELTGAYAEPFACASALGMLSVSRIVRENATVLLTGDGGDDVFLGYPEHKHFYMAQKMAQYTPDLARKLWMSLRKNFPKVGVLKRASTLFDLVSGGLGAVGKVRDGLPVYQNNEILGERLKDTVIAHRQMKWSAASARNLLAEFLDYDRKTRFVGEYLPKVDGGTMLHALEARSPFLDTDLWEFAATLPFSIRLHKGNLKAVLREIARRRISNEVATGRKQGFSVPVQRWITGHWRKTIEEVFHNSILEKDGWIKSSAVLKMLERSAGENWSPRQLWFLYVLESWMRFEKESTTVEERATAIV